MNAELSLVLKQARVDADDWRAGIRERDARITALQQYEYKVLKRWLRRAAIIEARHDHVLWFVANLAGIISLGLPLTIVVLSFAWRLATWAVLS